VEHAASLSPFQESLVRSAVGRRAEIVRARWLQAMRPCPILVEASDEGATASVVLRIARNDGGVEREAAVYPPLRRMGLPVPRVLAGPARDPSAPDLFAMSVVERLAGEPLSHWAEGSDGGASLAAERLTEAYGLLRGVTEECARAPEFAALPRRSLHDDMEDVLRRGGEWLEVAEIRDAAARLARRVERDGAPLMFSNGDFAPANLLSDGATLTGMLDFEKAAFVDPLSTLTRFPVYDLRPLSRTSFVASLLAEHGHTPRDLAPRVAVFCLRTLQTKCPVEGGAPHRRALRRHVLGVLGEAMEDVD
jgi:hypothetical protein